MQKGKNSWTRFEFRLRQEGAIVESELRYLTPESYRVATADAIRKAEFLIISAGFDFDENNFTLMLIADA